MTRLGGADSVSTWRLSTGAALVSAGILTVALGAANVAETLFVAIGVAPATAWIAGVTVGGALVPILIYGVASRLHTPAPYDRAVTVGVGTAGLGIVVVSAVLWLTMVDTLVAMVAAVPYAAGVVLSLWAVVASAAAPRPPSRPMYTETSTTPSRASAADGGEEDDLSFPLDEDR